jgi:hypothetical protein
MSSLHMSDKVMKEWEFCSTVNIQILKRMTFSGIFATDGRNLCTSICCSVTKGIFDPV